MSSPTDIARFAALAISLLGCGANGDQLLGTIQPEDNNPIQVDASTPSLDANGGCNVLVSSQGHEIGSNLDVYFLIDRSQSMVDPVGDKWDAFVSGFSHFLRSMSLDGIGIGAGYYPAAGNPDCTRCPPRDCMCLASCGCPCNMQGDPRSCMRGPVCDPNTYDRADVDIGAMPQNGSALLLSLAQPVLGPAVIRPALEGALEFASEHEQRNRNERVEVVLVAGGPPSSGDCMPDMVSDCADAAGNSNTKTNVVAFDYGSGPSLEPVAFRGSGRFYTFDSHRDDIGARFVDVVSELKNAPHCHYDLPQDIADPGKVNLRVTFTNDAGMTELIRHQVKDRASCNGGPGWYYDRPDHPTRIIACDATCKEIHGPPEGNVWIVGCGAPLPP